MTLFPKQLCMYQDQSSHFGIGVDGRPVGRGGFEGVRANPPFDLQIILYTPLNCTFKYPTV